MLPPLVYAMAASDDGFDAMQTNGDWQGAFPMPIRITSAIGETLEDSISSMLPPHCHSLCLVCLQRVASRLF